MSISSAVSLFKGMVYGILSLLVFSFLISLIFFLTPLSTALLPTFSSIIYLLSLFLGAFVAARSLQKRGLIFGLIFGAIFFLLMIIINYLGLRIGFTASTWFQLIYSLIAGTLGGIAGVSSK